MHPEGRLLLTIHDADGTLVAERRTKNRVLQGGAKLIAELFSSKRKTSIDKVRFGFGTDPLPPEGTELRKRFVDTGRFVGMFMDLSGPLPEQALAEEDFSEPEIGPNAVTVRIRVRFKPAGDIPDVSEAGLYAGEELYNHVLFEPIDMAAGQDVTFFWKIDFPYGT